MNDLPPVVIEGIDFSSEEIEAADYVVRGLKEAGRNSLLNEVMVHFLRGMRNGHPVMQAINEALYEWDI